MFRLKYLREASFSNHSCLKGLAHLTTTWVLRKGSNSHPIKKSKSSYAIYHICDGFTYFLLSWMSMRKAFVWVVSFVLLCKVLKTRTYNWRNIVFFSHYLTYIFLSSIWISLTFSVWIQLDIQNNSGQTFWQKVEFIFGKSHNEFQGLAPLFLEIRCVHFHSSDSGYALTPIGRKLSRWFYVSGNNFDCHLHQIYRPYMVEG